MYTRHCEILLSKHLESRKTFTVCSTPDEDIDTEECLAFLASGSDPTCRVSIIYTTWPKSHAYHGVQGLRSRDSCHVQPQGCVLTAKQSVRHGVVEAT